MGRKNKSIDRFLAPDPRFSDALVTKFINNIMRRGKKSVATAAFYGAMDRIAKKVADKEPVEVFRTGLENVRPMLEVRSRRVGGANYQVPTEVRPARRQALAIRWLLDAARKRHERTMADRLAGELVDAFNNT
ncbi:MAG: 30S ribosomal protein S7, partial [Candidatus Sumerlaeota bacterium]|nr:30S ribosomal protein S7 [Candidatus Sumerlaeota bacterium]